MPQLTGAGAPPGGTLTATVETEDGDLVILAVGLPGPLISITGFADPFWLDPTAHAFVAIGTHTATSPITASVPVPSNPGFLGVCLNWQAACYGPVTGFQATNPTVTLVH
jgi:hypothetical protein